ncbi:MAG TPA: magnesium transporter [Chloroflexi bacterium]|nr:magnesium transporter [Chloroflexota bacterium]
MNVQQNLYDLAREHLDAGDMQALKAVLDQADMDDLRALIENLAPRERVLPFRLLGKDRALALFEQLDVEQRQDLIASFTQERANDIFGALDPDDRARLLDELPAAVAKRLVEALPPTERSQVNLLLGYKPETAGRIMTPKYVRLMQEMTVAEALEKVRRVGREQDDIHTLYVTDAERRLLGQISLNELILAQPEERIASLMDIDLLWATTETDQEEAARLLQHHDLLSLPVVDQGQRLVGVITIDDAMEIMEEEVTEDFFDKAALASFTGRETGRSYRLANGSLRDIWPVRMPFLLIAMVGGLLAGTVIGAFEHTIGSIPMLAIFIPVVMDMGGNAGTQSSTIFARALALGHINLRRFGVHLLREMSVGLSIGAVLGVVTGVIAALWQGVPALGLVVGLSLMFTTALATTLGFLIPYVLVRVGADPAAGADPIITTIKDITGLLIYFFLAYFLLGPMLL